MWNQHWCLPLTTACHPKSLPAGAPPPCSTESDCVSSKVTKCEKQGENIACTSLTAARKGKFSASTHCAPCRTTHLVPRPLQREDCHLHSDVAPQRMSAMVVTSELDAFVEVWVRLESKLPPQEVPFCTRKRKVEFWTLGEPSSVIA